MKAKEKFCVCFLKMNIFYAEMKEPVEKQRFKKLLINKLSKEKNRRGLNNLI